MLEWALNTKAPAPVGGVPSEAIFKSHDGEPLLVSNNDDGFAVWTPSTYKNPQILEDNDLESYSSRFRETLLSPDGRFVVLVQDKGDSVNILNLEEIIPSIIPSIRDDILSLCKFLVMICMITIKSTLGKKSFTYLNHLEEELFVESPDGSLLVGGASAKGLSTIIWDTKTGKERCRIKVSRNFSSLQFSPDGKICATLSGKGI